MRNIAFLLIAGIAWGQAPRIGVIDFYGRRKASQENLRKALGAKEGDPLPRSKGDVEEALENVDPVVQARLQAVCCEEGNAILYIGLEEKGAAHFDYWNPPAGAVQLPAEIHGEYARFLAAMNLAARAGDTGEDLSAGHSFMTNPGVRGHQERFLDLAQENLDVLREVLKDSADAEQRAIAAYVIGYAPKDKDRILSDVMTDLQRALRDPDDTVRNNALRSLGAIAVLGAKKPELQIHISPTWFLEMLDSLIWTDRIAAAGVLVTLTEARDPDLLARVRERRDTLAEMASWKHLPHALPAFILLGRASGEEEAEIQRFWSAEERKPALERWLSMLSRLR